MTEITHPRGSYFEEFVMGSTHLSEERVITEADIFAFSELTGDHNPLHLDAEFASKSGFGQRIAQGLLGLSIASGLLTQLGFIDGTLLAFREPCVEKRLTGDRGRHHASVSAFRSRRLRRRPASSSGRPTATLPQSVTIRTQVTTISA